MNTDINAQTLKDHQHLINLIDELIAALKGIPRDVQYPLYRFEQLHQTQRELLAGGNIFVSPFPRDDANF